MEERDILKTLNDELKSSEVAIIGELSQTKEEHNAPLEEFKSFKVQSNNREDFAFEEGMAKAEGELALRIPLIDVGPSSAAATEPNL